MVANPQSIFGVIMTGPTLLNPLNAIPRPALGVAAAAVTRVYVPIPPSPGKGMKRSA